MLRVYKKADADRALQIKAAFPIKSIGQNRFADGAMMRLEFSRDGCIDGSSHTSTIKSKFAFTGTATIPGNAGLTALFVATERNRDNL